jgi:hypothetical protein
VRAIEEARRIEEKRAMTGACYGLKEIGFIGGQRGLPVL